MTLSANCSGSIISFLRCCNDHSVARARQFTKWTGFKILLNFYYHNWTLGTARIWCVILCAQLIWCKFNKCVFIYRNLWLLLGPSMLMDPHPSQEHVGLQYAVWQLQQEVTRPRARFEPTLPISWSVASHVLPMVWLLPPPITALVGLWRLEL